MENNWYVLRAVAGQERKAKSYLETEIARSEKLQKAILQIIIPIEKVVELKNGKKKVRDKISLPGYILIEADLNDGEVFHAITGIPGVLGFLEGTARDEANDTKRKLAYAKQPIPLRQSEVNRILGAVDEQEEVSAKIEASFIVGEHIKVMDGPFNGFDGVVEQVFDERKKLNVMVKVFGRNTPVELNYTQVEKEN
jgi:transcription termination/antitermination protein NusG